MANAHFDKVAIWRFITEFVTRSQRSNMLRREFQSLDREEADRFLRDCAITHSEFQSSLRNPFYSEDLLSPAMRAIGLDPNVDRIKHAAWHRDIERTCMACRYRRRCRHDVTSRRFEANYRDYCPNTESFDEML